MAFVDNTTVKGFTVFVYQTLTVKDILQSTDNDVPFIQKVFKTYSIDFKTILKQNVQNYFLHRILDLFRRAPPYTNKPKPIASSSAEGKPSSRCSLSVCIFPGVGSSVPYMSFPPTLSNCGVLSRSFRTTLWHYVRQIRRHRDVWTNPWSCREPRT